MGPLVGFDLIFKRELRHRIGRLAPGILERAGFQTEVSFLMDADHDELKLRVCLIRRDEINLVARYLCVDNHFSLERFLEHVQDARLRLRIAAHAATDNAQRVVDEILKIQAQGPSLSRN